ncbi:MAG TPA: hypothetical protein VLG92_02315 [Candidatus Saccharimonadia bacterium]|nr:hypothetical protein [Candidatus Saccharimonadia bacterium]
MKIRRFIVHAVLGCLVLVGLAGSTVTAAGTSSNNKTTSSSSTQKATGGGSVQGYAADSALQYGTVVQLAGGATTKVAPATAKDLGAMYGVTVDPHELSISISSSNLSNEAYVATSGTFNVLVSTQNGAISAGDYITMSAIDGVLMKAGSYDDQKIVFGRAAGGFSGKSNSIGSTSLHYSDNKTTQTVALGMVPVAINIERNPNQKSTKANLPPALQKLGEAIADKPVSPTRIYLSIGITGLSIIVALVTLYAGIRNALIAIGRNPLSKKSIFRGLLEIILTGFIILIIGLFAVYLLLKL